MVSLTRAQISEHKVILESRFCICKCMGYARGKELKSMRSVSFTQKGKGEQSLGQLPSICFSDALLGMLLTLTFETSLPRTVFTAAPFARNLLPLAGGPPPPPLLSADEDMRMGEFDFRAPVRTTGPRSDAALDISVLGARRRNIGERQRETFKRERREKGSARS